MPRIKPTGFCQTIQRSILSWKSILTFFFQKCIWKCCLQNVNHFVEVSIGFCPGGNHKSWGNQVTNNKVLRRWWWMASRAIHVQLGLLWAPQGAPQTPHWGKAIPQPKGSCHSPSNFNFMEISFFSCHQNYKQVIATKFCTCHDSTAVLACAKFCSNMMNWNGATSKLIFHQILSWRGKSLVTWALALMVQMMSCKMPSTKMLLACCLLNHRNNGSEFTTNCWVSIISKCHC